MVKLILVKKDGSLFEEKNILSFVFSKDMYVPYTELSVRFKAQSEDFNNVCEVKLVSGGKEIPHGCWIILIFIRLKTVLCAELSRGDLLHCFVRIKLNRDLKQISHSIRLWTAIILCRMSHMRTIPTPAIIFTSRTIQICGTVLLISAISCMETILLSEVQTV